MDAAALRGLTHDLLLVLAAGLAAGLLCKRLNVSLLIGYMLAGAVLGGGGLGLVGGHSALLEGVASAGALLLLFSVGVEFSLDELRTRGRQFLLGGATQMLLSGVPVGLVGAAFGLSWPGALVVGAAASLSSTVLVFKGIAELGQLASPAGRQGIAVLLFQDVMLAPLVLLAPLLSGQGGAPPPREFVDLAAKTAILLGGVWALRRFVGAWAMQWLAQSRSAELLCLFAVTLLGGTCLAAAELGLPPALGALAAGVMLSGTRLSGSIDAMVLPFRETFAAVFFVTLGALLRPQAFFQSPLLMTGGLLGMIAVKATAGAIALRLTGLAWRSAWGMGLGLAQLGEFSFLLLLEGRRGEVISQLNYERTLLIALGTLLATPQLLKWGVSLLQSREEEAAPGRRSEDLLTATDRVLVVGAGPIGRDVAAYLETLGRRVTVLDLSPVNVHRFAQQGFETAVGDARTVEVLRRVGVDQIDLAVICVPDDETAGEVAAAIKRASGRCRIVARCRYLQSIAGLKRAGAAAVVSEEVEAARALLAAIGDGGRKA